MSEVFFKFKKWWQNYSLGYYANQNGILQRFLREEGNWEEHLSNSRQVILSEVERVNPKTVAILGSGWLLDIPIKELVDLGVSVTLFDIVHPRKIVNRYKGIDSIKFVDFDLTFNAIGDINTFIRKPTKFNFEPLINSIKSSPDRIVFNYDLVISVNTLSQLHAPFSSAFESNKNLALFNIQKLIEALQFVHIKSLPANKSLLITETYEEVLDSSNKLQSESPRIYFNLLQFEKVKEWYWLFDTRSIYIDDYTVRKRVEAYRV